jgi:hypothetical protein
MNLRYPDLSGSPNQQVNQLRDYLFYLVDELQFNNSSIQQEISTAGAAPPVSQTIISTATPNEKTPKEVFDSIKDLIIRSADIVDAYSRIITEDFEGHYVAVSDFGVYAEDIKQQIVKTNEEITQSFSEISAVTTNIEGLRDELLGVDGKIASSVTELGNSLGVDIGAIDDKLANALAYIKETNAYIRHGKLDGDQYGIEVGQEDKVNGETSFKAFARFTSSRLSFFDSNGTEAAYISQNKLYINNAVFKYSMTVGELVTKILTNGDIIERWL